MDELQALYSSTLTSSCFEGAWRNHDYDELWKFTEQNDYPPERKDSLLLKLAVIQKLFQRLESPSCPYLVKIGSDHSSLGDVMNGLMMCLGSKDQHVAFFAAKSIAVILRTISKDLMTIDWIHTLLDFTDYEPNSEGPWRHLYTIDLLRQVVKSIRERQQMTSRLPFQEYSQMCDCHCDDSDTGIAKASGSELTLWVFKSFNLLHIFFRWIPSVVRPNGIYSFVSKSSTVGCSVADISLLQACLKLGCAIHAQEDTQCVFSRTKEQTFIAFLHLLLELERHLQDNKTNLKKLNDVQNQPGSSVKDAECCSSKTLSTASCVAVQNTGCNTEVLEEQLQESSQEWALFSSVVAKEDELCTVVTLLTQYLHYQKLPCPVHKKILEVLNQVIALPLSTVNSSSKTDKTDHKWSKKILRQSAISLLSVVECCLFNNVPRCSGFVGFGGSKLRNSHGMVRGDTPNQTDLIAFRKTTLLILKSVFIALGTATEQGGYFVIQNLSLKCFNVWNSSFLSLSPEILSGIGLYSPGHRQSSHLLVSLFSDQDDELIEALLLFLLLFQKVESMCNSDKIQKDFIDQFNPHCLFFSFVESIDFDHLVLLDFLISSETRFLEYILHYLHFVLRNWEHFVQSLESHVYEMLSNMEETKETTRCRNIAVSGQLFSAFESENGELPSTEKTVHLEMYKDVGLSSSVCYQSKTKVTEPFSSERSIYNEIVNRPDESNRIKNGNRNATFQQTSHAAGKIEFNTREVNLFEASALEALAVAYSSEDESCSEDEGEIIGTSLKSTREKFTSLQEESVRPSSCKNISISLEGGSLTKEGETFVGDGFMDTGPSDYILGIFPGNTSRGKENRNPLTGTNRFVPLENSANTSVSSGAEVFPHGDKSRSYGTKLPLLKAGDIETRPAEEGHEGMPTKYLKVSDTTREKVISSANIHGLFRTDLCGETGDSRTSNLDKIMSMLIRLRIAVARLSHGGKFPYPALPLLKLMENVELLYDGC